MSPLSRSAQLAIFGSPITALARCPRTDGVWVATTAPIAQLLSVKPGAPPSDSRVSTLRGDPELRRAQVMPDRRTVLVQDADGASRLVDLLTTQPLACALPRAPPPSAAAADAAWAALCGAANAELERLEAAHPQRRALRAFLPAWCTVDVRLGSLAVHLEPSSAFCAEALHRELFPSPSPADAAVRLNVGEQALLSLLRNALPGKPDATAPQLLNRPSLFPPPSPPAVLLFEAASGGRRRASTQRMLPEPMQLELPSWARDAFSFGPPPASGDREVSRATFSLSPEEGSGLPSLGGRLHAGRCAFARDVAAYAAKKLKVEEELELLCAGVPVPPDASVAEAAALLWRSSEPLAMHYRRTGGEGREGAEQP
jgi:hypothetical protein